MQRKTKFAENQFYHIYSRGVEKRQIFMDENDKKRFVALLYIMNQTEKFELRDYLKSRKLWEIFQERKSEPLISVLAYTLMPNHFHLLFHENREGGISKFMLRLLTAYSMYFNKKYERSGPLFVRPFRATHIYGEQQFLYIFSYIHLNPLGIKGNGITPRDSLAAENFLGNYDYSSYIDYLGSIRPCSKIIDLSLVPEYVLNARLDFSLYKKWRGVPEGTPPDASGGVPSGK